MKSKGETGDRRDGATDMGAVFAMLLMRVWLAVRALVTGIEKFAGRSTGTAEILVDGEPNVYGLTDAVSEKIYGLSHYHGVPKSMYDKFLAEPLIPESMLKLYDLVLGPLLLVTGLMLLFGIATRVSLLAMGLLYTSLTVGLILLNQDGGIAWLAAHMILIVLMLLNARHNRFEVTGRWKW